MAGQQWQAESPCAHRRSLGGRHIRAFALTHRLDAILGSGSSVTPLMSPMQSTGFVNRIVACLTFAPQGILGAIKRNVLLAILRVNVATVVLGEE